MRATLFTVLLCLASSPAFAGSGSAAKPDAQLDFGVQMARRGLWSEALFRFQQVERLELDSFRICNNLAVAYEANGMFDKALDYYQRALRLAPSDRSLRRNYSRFIEFYQSFKPKQEPAAAAEPSAATPATPAPPADAADDSAPPGGG